MAINRKCWKGFPHLWETDYQTVTHIVQYCTRCKGRNWKARRTVDDNIAQRVAVS